MSASEIRTRHARACPAHPRLYFMHYRKQDVDGRDIGERLWTAMTSNNIFLSFRVPLVVRDDRPPTKSREARFQQRCSKRDLVGRPQGSLPHLRCYRCCRKSIIPGNDNQTPLVRWLSSRLPARPALSDAFRG